ncbi:NADH dehydrogenase [ubiquinone] 1 alpha subcomplex assembly factor 3 [Trichoplax sp. H2]|nr:NADH dehydrogenase [ubiquinone] 1 alpha subcomplex assembly factor 3 [Trichoplax sp. H2]|eukprot:RDD47084.1 NADH dehydrogenase [ubiquinone] 1 alpha subcomplex assembly factor 3 [Trichoplax sp. H2]
MLLSRTGRNLKVYARRWTSPLCRFYSVSGEHDILRTSLEVIAGSDQMPIIKSYSSQGFSIGNIKIIGPAAILPKGFFLWKVKRNENITARNLSLFPVLVPRIDILVIGTGNNLAVLHPDVLKYLRSNAIAVEVQDTPNACATFNFLLEEGRQVAAALIPPAKLNTTPPPSSTSVHA